MDCDLCIHVFAIWFIAFVFSWGGGVAFLSFPFPLSRSSCVRVVDAANGETTSIFELGSQTTVGGTDQLSR